MEEVKLPKCPYHNKDLETIYPKLHLRLCQFECNCIYMKDGTFIPKGILFKKTGTKEE